MQQSVKHLLPSAVSARPLKFDPHDHKNCKPCLVLLLACSAHDGQLQLVKLLIRAGAAVTARGRGGQTALHEAAKCPLDAYQGEKRMPQIFIE